MRSIIVEGIDRLGKDTLIERLQHRLGFFQEIHYQKPKVLDRLLDEAPHIVDGVSGQKTQLAQLSYQAQSFFAMFEMLSSPTRFIMNRAHLGECVYGPRYRKYDAEYVFELENQFPLACEHTLLILLVTHNFDLCVDDGNSLDFDKKVEEQDDFIDAFARSKIKHKHILRVNSEEGTWREKKDIENEAVAKYLGA